MSKEVVYNKIILFSSVCLSLAAQLVAAILGLSLQFKLSFRKTNWRLADSALKYEIRLTSFSGLNFSYYQKKESFFITKIRHIEFPTLY